MPEFTSTPSAGPALPEPSGWRARIAPALRRHGAWAPGVTLMRRIDLRGKALLLMLCVLLPGLLLLGNAVRDARADIDRVLRSQERLAQNEALQAASESLRRLQIEALRATGDATPDDLAPLLSQDRQRFDALEGLIVTASFKDAGIDAAMQALRQRRAEFESLYAPFASAQISSHPGWMATAQGSLTRLRSELEALRQLIQHQATLDSGSADPSRLLFDGAVRPMPKLSQALLGAAGSTALLFGTDAPARREAVDRLAQQRAEARWWLDQARAPLQKAQDSGLLGAAAVPQSLASIEAQLDRLERLGRVALTSAAGSEFIAASATTAQQFNRHTQQALQATDAIEAAGLRALQGLMAQQLSTLKRERLVDAAAMSAALLGALYLMVCAYKVLGGGLSAVCSNVQELAKGNLGIRPQAYGDDEVGRALRSLSDAAERMAGLFDAVNRGVSAVSQASYELAAGNAGQVQRTGEVRAAIGDVAQHTMALCGVLDDCGKEVAHAVADVHALQHEARHSGQAMAELRERMRALSGNSHEVGHRVQSLDSVALQSKLASNALVEAAHADTHGQDFAVLAQQLRSLALRNEAAAHAIRGTISGSLTEIEACHRLTERAGEAVHTTDQRIEAVQRSLGGVVRQTERGINESQRVMRLTRQVQASIGANAQLVDQLSNASAALRTQGETLRSSVQMFVPG